MMLRRCLLVAIGWVTLVSTGWAGETLDAIKARGTLRVGTTGDYKPYSFREPDGDYRGVDIDMATRFADRVGVRLELVPTVWATMMTDFKARKFDIAVGGITVLPAREAVGLFSRVVVVDGKRPIARCADKESFTTLGAINRPEVRVIVNPGAANEQFAREQFPHAHLIVHSDNATVFDEIVERRADVMVTDGIEVDHQAFIHSELCPTDVAAPFTRLEKAYWLQPDKELLATVDNVVSDVMDSGEWVRLLNMAQRQP